MRGVIFFETLRRNWRGTLLWGFGIGVLAASQVLTLPNVDALKEYAKVMETLPPMLLQAVGGGDIQFLATPEGYLASQYFGIALVVFAIYGVTAGLGITTSEEDRGVMDMLLSLPVPRWRIIVERLLAYTLLVSVIVAITFVCLWASLLATPALQIDTGRLLESTVNVLPGTLFVLAFTTLVGTVLRTRGAAIAIAIAFAIGSYFVNFIGEAASGTLADSLRVISFYRYYDSTAVMQNGLAWGNILLLLVAALVCAGGAGWFFERRDIGV